MSLVPIVQLVKPALAQLGKILQNYIAHEKKKTDLEHDWS